VPAGLKAGRYDEDDEDDDEERDDGRDDPRSPWRGRGSG
jgi:hypothetical protein